VTDQALNHPDGPLDRRLFFIQCTERVEFGLRPSAIHLPDSELLGSDLFLDLLDASGFSGETAQVVEKDRPDSMAESVTELLLLFSGWDELVEGYLSPATNLPPLL